jgi:hypothetical protein
MQVTILRSNLSSGSLNPTAAEFVPRSFGSHSTTSPKSASNLDQAAAGLPNTAEEAKPEAMEELPSNTSEADAENIVQASQPRAHSLAGFSVAEQQACEVSPASADAQDTAQSGVASTADATTMDAIKCLSNLEAGTTGDDSEAVAETVRNFKQGGIIDQQAQRIEES